MIQSLRTWPYLETSALALASGLFLHILDDKLMHGRLTIVFWTGFGCGSALTLVLLLIGFCILAGVRGVQSSRVDLNRRAASHSMEMIPQTPQNSGFQHGLADFIKNTARETYDGYATNICKHFGVKVGTLLTLGKIPDQVLCAATKEKLLHKFVYALLGGTKLFTLKEVDLGTKPPQITEIRLQGGLDECAVEIGVRWESEGARLKAALYLLCQWDIIQIENMHLEGTIKLVLKPLRGDTSGFGAVLVSLKEDPRVDYDLDCAFLLFNGLLKNSKQTVQECIKSALMKSIVWPRRVVLPTIPGEDVSFWESRPVGDLKVTLIKVEDIVHTHHVGKVDLFVEIDVHQIQVERSTFKKSSKGPALWNETFTVQVEDPETQKLTLRLLRRSRLTGRLPDKLIGSGKLPIAQFNPGVEMEMWCGLRNPKTNEIHGKLYLAVTYHPYP